MRQALIKDGKVKNVIVANEKFLSRIRQQWDHIVELSKDTSVGIGWSYDGQNFSAPQPEPPSTADAQRVTLKEKIATIADPKIQEILNEVIALRK